MTSHFKYPSRIIVALTLAAVFGLSVGPSHGQSVTDPVNLQTLARDLADRWEQRRSPLYYQLLQSSNLENPGAETELMGIEGGRPIYYTTHNIFASATTNTSTVWPFGGGGYWLTGSGTAFRVLRIWDQVLANDNHVELVGRVDIGEAWPDGSHATHVAGTMIASGIDGYAKGMSYQGRIISFNWTDDTVEVAQQAALGLQISNHSYGLQGGWGGLQWYGDVTLGTHEDWRFGFYDSLAAEWDMIAHNAPLLLMVRSAGNDRNDVDPGLGFHQHWENGGWMHATDYHPPDGSPFGFDTITDVGCAKNILTVGAIKDIPGAYSQPSDVVQTAFSSWGPADDGRIKPDIVANGDSVYSSDTFPNGDTSYNFKSGTSMAAPNVSGSINLLRELYESIYPGKPRSATLKALVLHTADEAGGANGPDYSNGWGLLNTGAAADVISASPTSDAGLEEELLVHGTTDEYYFNVAAPGDARVTIVWTDLPGVPPVYVIDPVAKMLVNDLDLRIQNIGTSMTYYPWRLDKNNPLGVANTGDNNVDNVERIDAYNVPAGNYRVTVSHKGTIVGGEQPYSLVWTGMVLTTATAAGSPSSTPRLALTVPYANPSSGFTSIEFTLGTEGPVSIALFDLRGRQVKTILNGKRPAGPGRVRVDTRDLPAGVYIVRMEAASQRLVQKITIIR